MDKLSALELSVPDQNPPKRIRGVPLAGVLFLLACKDFKTLGGTGKNRRVEDWRLKVELISLMEALYRGVAQEIDAAAKTFNQKLTTFVVSNPGKRKRRSATLTVNAQERKFTVSPQSQSQRKTKPVSLEIGLAREAALWRFFINAERSPAWNRFAFEADYLLQLLIASGMEWKAPQQPDKKSDYTAEFIFEGVKISGRVRIVQVEE